MKNHLWNAFATINNGQSAKKSIVILPRQSILESFLQILWDEGFISGYSVRDSYQLKVFLKYRKTGEPAINVIKFMSKPSQRVYYSSKQIWKIDSSKTFLIFSTNKGLKSLKQCKKGNVGGEPFIFIY